MADSTMPEVVEQFAVAQPAVWHAYNELGEAVAQAGPLDAKTQRLIKLALAVGAGREGAVRSHARQGRKAGLSLEEMNQVAMLGITTVGWPQAFAAHCWIGEALGTVKPKG